MNRTSPSSALRGNLLVVEDQIDHQHLIARYLRGALPDATITFASSPEEALTYLQATKESGESFPRLVLLDICLPEAQMGWSLLQELRTRYRSLPVIVLSAHYQGGEVQQAYQLGAHSFIGKPLDQQEWARYMDTLRIYWMQTVTLPAEDN